MLHLPRWCYDMIISVWIHCYIIYDIWWYSTIYVYDMYSIYICIYIHIHIYYTYIHPYTSPSSHASLLQCSQAFSAAMTASWPLPGSRMPSAGPRATRRCSATSRWPRGASPPCGLHRSGGVQEKWPGDGWFIWGSYCIYSNLTGFLGTIVTILWQLCGISGQTYPCWLVIECGPIIWTGVVAIKHVGI